MPQRSFETVREALELANVHAKAASHGARLVFIEALAPLDAADD